MGHSGDRCDSTSTLCKYDLRKGATNEAGKHLFRAVHMCWRGMHYFGIASYS